MEIHVHQFQVAASDPTTMMCNNCYAKVKNYDLFRDHCQAMNKKIEASHPKCRENGNVTAHVVNCRALINEDHIDYSDMIILGNDSDMNCQPIVCIPRDEVGTSVQQVVENMVSSANVSTKRLHSDLIPSDFECGECPKRFRHDEHLNGEGISYSCHLCRVNFNKQRCLEAHMKAIHSVRTLYRCSIAACSKTFSSKSNGYIHMKGVHAKHTKKVRCHLAMSAEAKKKSKILFWNFWNIQ